MTDAREPAGQNASPLGEIKSERWATSSRNPRATSYRYAWATSSESAQTGEPPALFGIETPRPRLETIKIVDMAASNSWAGLAATYLRTREAHGDHELAKTELKKLVPEDAKEAVGHGIKAKRSKSGAISFEALQVEVAHASVQ
ncbi:protein of unknown function [Bradyrhizobium vignae]|uniref:Uncharacterized protein n=1 Tax=Bradyrhizobium vignae TaxID=1549949 RepID=A0A2U3PYC9_9BRAD|nr:protein of unknown function [Bradyrhizobium vignae]